MRCKCTRLLFIAICGTFLLVLSPGWAVRPKVECADSHLTSGVDTGKMGSPSLIGPLQPSSRDWVEKRLLDGRSVVLTNSYLFQVMKGIAQQNQKLAEESILIPLLFQTLRGLVDSTGDEETRRLFGVGLLLLVEKSDIDFPEQIKQQAHAIRSNPLFTPRGHYVDSEEMQRYFQAMQFLSKATVDVAVKREAFPFPMEMLYPFDTATKIRELFSNPENSGLLANWKTIHSFYDSVNGPSDLPTFVELLDQFKSAELTRQTVEKWMQQQHRPKINVEMGLGIQPFGERFTLHQGMIDEVKRKLIKQDTPREEMAKILRFRNLAAGPNADGDKIRGLAERIRSEKGQSYYAASLRAVSLGGKGWRKNLLKLNFFASSLTSLAEQTALMTKTSTEVAKSAAGPTTINKGLRLYFEPGSENYLLALAKSSDIMVRTCNDLQRNASGTQADKTEFIRPTHAFRTFAGLARQGKPLVTGSSQWQVNSRVIAELSRTPTVTVDIFRVKDQTGKTFFYQWAIAPFEMGYGSETPKGPAGMEMVFFEAWADEIEPNVDGPLTNLEWQRKVSAGGLKTPPSIIRMPDKEGVAR